MSENSEAREESVPENPNDNISDRFDLGDLDDNFDLFEDEEDEDYSRYQESSNPSDKASDGSSSIDGSSSTKGSATHNTPESNTRPESDSSFGNNSEDSASVKSGAEDHGFLGSSTSGYPNSEAGIEEGINERAIESDEQPDEFGRAMDSIGAMNEIDENIWEEDHTEVLVDAASQDTPQAALIDKNGKKYLVNHVPFTIGRSKECDLVLVGKGISRQHAELDFSAGDFRIRDLKSLNGTKVNGQGRPSATLGHGDEIRIGNISFNLELEGCGAQGHYPQAGLVEDQRPDQGIKRHRDFAIHDNVELSNPYENSPNDSMSFLLKVNFVLIALVFIFGGIYMVVNFDSRPKSSFDFSEDFNGEDFNGEELSDIYDESVYEGPEAPLEAPFKSRVNTRIEELINERSSREAKNEQENMLIEGSGAIEAPFVDENDLSQLARAKEIKRQKLEIDSLFEIRKRMEEENEKRQINQAKIKAEAERESINVEANRLLLSFRDVYVKGEGFNSTLEKIFKYSENQNIKSSLKGQLASQHQLYSGLSESYQKGMQAYQRGEATLAFEEWTAFMAKEKEAIGSNDSYFSAEVKKKVVEAIKTEAKADELNGFYHEAYTKWQKAVKLNSDAEAREALTVFDEQAETLFIRATQIEQDNPVEAMKLLEEVVDLVPPEHSFHTRASAKLSWIKEWGGY